MATITMREEIVGGATRSYELDLGVEVLTAAELIQRQVTAEIARQSADASSFWWAKRRNAEVSRLDAEQETLRAHAAFESNQIYLLVNERQVEQLDELIAIRPGMEICFLRLIPLVGG